MQVILDAAIVSLDGALVVITIAGLGAMLARFEVSYKQILDGKKASILSEMTVSLLLPCLLFCELIQNLDISALGLFALIGILSTVHIVLGMGIGWLMGKLTRAYTDLRNLMMVCIGFQDTTAIPLVYASILGTDAITSADPNFSAEAVEYVLLYSMYLIIYKWTVAYLVLEKKDSKLEEYFNPAEETFENKSFWGKLKQIMNPPIYACLVAVPLALVPYVKDYVLAGESALLGKNVFSALATVGSTASPIIDLLLGVNLSYGYPPDTDVSNLQLSLILLGKLVIMPAIGFAITSGLYWLGIINRVLAVMIVVIYASPISLQLLMICTNRKNQVSNVSKISLVQYLAAALPMTFWTVLALLYYYEF